MRLSPPFYDLQSNAQIHTIMYYSGGVVYKYRVYNLKILRKKN